jgi:hypothetical protein
MKRMEDIYHKVAVTIIILIWASMYFIFEGENG